MKEYLLSVFAICTVVGLVSFLSHGKLRSAERIVLGIITLYVILSPLPSAIKNFDVDDFFSFDTDGVGEQGGDISEVAEEAFARGVALAVAEEFSLEASDIRVRVEGFDFEKMSAERIRVTLSGRASTADYRAVEEYLNKQQFGRCEVEIEIG